jgi:two-component system KDP operon response regulator KdpE
MKRSSPTILVIDDDPRIRRLLQLNLQAEGYTVLTAASGREGLDLLVTQQPDALILDLILPDMDGLVLCERVREFSDIPIIVLTARTSEDAMVSGLNIGADDYVVKPFSQKALLARLRATLRRASFSQSSQDSLDLVCGDIALHCRERKLTIGQQSVKLSHTEFKLLYFLMENANRLITTDELVARVWGPEFVGETENLRTYIRYLRLKLEDDLKSPQRIVTERGLGYMFVDPVSDNYK